MEDRTLFAEQNSMNFYTWGDANCCLPAGATEATLLGPQEDAEPRRHSALRGGPRAADRDSPRTPTPRTAAPSCSPASSPTDYKGRPLVDPLTGDAITRITWSAGDALPFPLCISSTTDSEHGSAPVFGVSVARGNIVPADHGITIAGEALPTVPPAPPAPPEASGCSCNTSVPAACSRSHAFIRSWPTVAADLQRPDFMASVSANGLTSAAAFLAPDPKTAKPQISAEQQ